MYKQIKKYNYFWKDIWIMLLGKQVKQVSKRFYSEASIGTLGSERIVQSKKKTREKKPKWYQDGG